MKTQILRLWPLLVLVLVAGCGDTYTDLMNEEAALANEFADALVKVVDEPSADYVQKFTFSKLKGKFKTLKERKDRFDKNTSMSRITSLDTILAGQEVGQKNSIKEGDFAISFSRVDKDTVQLEILCSSASLVNDLRNLFNPDTFNHFQSIKRRIDQQLLRIDALYSRLDNEQPDADFPALSSFKNQARETLPDGFPSISKLPIPFENFSNAVRAK